MRIYFDLDGTLIDAKIRLYTLFTNLVPQSNLTYDQYWDLKKDQTSHDQILYKLFNYSSNEIEVFKKDWMRLVESDKYLQMDKPIQNIRSILQSLKAHHELYVLTARQKTEKVYEQLQSFNLLEFFTKVIATEQKVSKIECLKKEGVAGTRFAMVGDTAGDIEAGKYFSGITIGVLSGFLNYRSIQKYSPNYIIEDVTYIQTIKL